MSRRVRPLYILLFMATCSMLVSLSFTGLARGIDSRSGNEVRIESDETIEDSVYLSGSAITVNGRIDGDVYCAGGTVFINADITGDVLCAAQNLRIMQGSIGGDVRIAALNANIDAPIQGSLLAFARMVSVGKESSIGGDATVFASRVSIRGDVARDVMIGGSVALLSGNIGRDADVEADSVIIRSGAGIGRDLTYKSPRKLERASGTVVRGSITRVPQQTIVSDPAAVVGATLLGLLFVLLSKLVLGLGLTATVPRFLQAATGRALQSPGRIVLLGLAAGLLVPAAIVALLVTGVGWLAAVFVAFCFLVALLLCWPLVAYLVGRLIFRYGPHNAFVLMTVGTLTVLVLEIVPVLGIVVIASVIVLGLGMLVSDMLQRIHRPTYRVRSLDDSGRPTLIPASLPRLAGVAKRVRRKKTKAGDDRRQI